MPGSLKCRHISNFMLHMKCLRFWDHSPWYNSYEKVVYTSFKEGLFVFSEACEVYILSYVCFNNFISDRGKFATDLTIAIVLYLYKSFISDKIKLHLSWKKNALEINCVNQAHSLPTLESLCSSQNPVVSVMFNWISFNPNSTLTSLIPKTLHKRTCFSFFKCLSHLMKILG